MDHAWYCRIGDRVLGPMSLDELRFLAVQGKVTSAHVVRKGTAGEWTSPAKVPELARSSRADVVEEHEQELAPIPDLDELEIESSSLPLQPLPLRSIPRKQKNHTPMLIGIAVAATLLLVATITVVAILMSSGSTSVVADATSAEDMTAPANASSSKPVTTKPVQKSPPAQTPAETKAPATEASKQAGASDTQKSAPANDPSSDSPSGAPKPAAPPQEDKQPLPTPTPVAPKNSLTSKGAIVALKDPFPSGAVFSPTDFKVTPDKIPATSRGDERGVIVLERRDESTWGMACQEKGLPHGVTLATHENQEPMVYLTYEKGSRDGLMRTWTEAGKPQLFTQYEKGRRHGLSCYYGEDGSLVAVLEYRRNELSAIRLVQADGDTALEFASESTARTDENAARILESIKAIEDHVMKNERVFRAQVRKAEAEFRQQLAAELAPIKRANIRERARQQATLGQKFFEDAVRRHMGR